MAIHMEQLLREGKVKDQAELAKLAVVTRARVTQVMGLLGLAPDIQELLLIAEPPTDQGRSSGSERTMRRLMVIEDWQKQRRLWVSIVCPAS